MAAKVLNLYPVLLLHLFKNDIDSLYCEDSAFLTYKDWRIDSNRIYMLVALFNMLLQLGVQSDSSYLACLLLNYCKLFSA